MFNFDVEMRNGKLVSTLKNTHVQYCIVWDNESIVSIVTPNGDDGALEFYYLPTKSK